MTAPRSMPRPCSGRWGASRKPAAASSSSMRTRRRRSTTSRSRSRRRNPTAGCSSSSTTRTKASSRPTPTPPRSASAPDPSARSSTSRGSLRRRGLRRLLGTGHAAGAADHLPLLSGPDDARLGPAVRRGRSHRRDAPGVRGPAGVRGAVPGHHLRGRRLPGALRQHPRRRSRTISRADPAVREALAAAIDKESIVAGVWQGYADPSTTMIPPAILGPAAANIAARCRRPGARR